MILKYKVTGPEMLRDANPRLGEDAKVSVVFDPREPVLKIKGKTSDTLHLLKLLQYFGVTDQKDYSYAFSRNEIQYKTHIPVGRFHAGFRRLEELGYTLTKVRRLYGPNGNDIKKRKES